MIEKIRDFLKDFFDWKVISILIFLIIGQILNPTIILYALSGILLAFFSIGAFMFFIEIRSRRK